MPEFKIRYLRVASDVKVKQTLVEKIVATNIVEAQRKADEKAKERTDEVFEWIVKAVEQI